MDLFDKYKKEGYSCNVTSAEIDPHTMTLMLDVDLDFVLPYSALSEAAEMLRSEVPVIEDVEYHFEFSDIKQPKKEAIMAFLPHVAKEYESQAGGLLNSLRSDDIVIGENYLDLKVVGKTAADALNEELAPVFTSKIRENLGFDMDVRFVHDEDQYKASEENAKKRVEEYVPERIRTAPSGGGNPGKSVNFDGVLLKGSHIKGETVQISSLTDESGTVIIEGEVFGIDTRNTKNDSKLVLFPIADDTATIMCKTFIKSNAWEVIEESFSPGIYVRVKGKAQWDDYSHAVTVMASDIEIVEKAKRKDECPEKRVELHAHTNMSALDGLSDPGKMVKLAAGWGHKAVAVTDHGVVQAFPDAYKASKGSDIKVIYGEEGYLFEDENGTIDHKKPRTNHIILLAKNQTGIKNLYKLVSLSHIKYFHKKPRLPRSVIQENREGIILGSACVAGELFEAMLAGESDERLDEIASFYDYLEIQPIINNMFLVRNGRIPNEEGLRDLNRKIIEIGERIGKPVCATCDSHYLESTDDVYRKVLQAGQNYDDIDQESGLFFRTTQEMLDEFAYLGEEKAYEVVIKNTNMIADMIEDVSPIAKGKFPPDIPNSVNILRDTCEKNAAEKYGTPLPAPIRERLDKELDSIIGNGYAVMYVSAQMLVEKSMSDGYVVGSRGSVGSSFAATMSGITEVNPLPAHYVCPKCKHLEWGDEELYSCGVDMPEKMCPECGTKMDQDGHNIPFETFLGFDGDKEPDIDLNFAGEYQHTAHRFVAEMFGEENIFKAGTIGAIKLKTARGFAMKYFEKIGKRPTSLDLDWYAQKCVGVKRTTGQHPGGIVILPKGHEIYEFTPVQRPANDTTSDITTTHFDYHSIDENLLKLDILGHDGPSLIRALTELTGVDATKVPLKDEKVNSIFNSTDALDIKVDNYLFKHGSYGIPEFGTSFVRQMLDDIKPTKFADLVQIAGLSHGTDVWLNNAQRFIREGVATIDEVICTRDDIMRYLIHMQLPASDSFKIMERVRKGKSLTEEQEEEMNEYNIPAWYIESCKLIKYMFPRAHAVAYVMMSYRIAYFKVYYPQAFYAAYLTSKISDFNWDVASQGIYAVEARMNSINGRSDDEVSDKEKQELIVDEIVYEMLARGYSFCPPSLTESKALKFTIDDGKVRVPLCALENVGASVGKMIEEQREVRPYETVEDLQVRGKTNKSAIESLRKHGVLEGMPESDQISFF